MDWINQDWEREAKLDAVYAQERQSLIEQEYFEYEKKRLPAQITYKKNGNKVKLVSLSRNSKERIQSRRNISSKISRKRKRRN